MSSNQRFVLILAAMALVGIAMMRVSPVSGQQSSSRQAVHVIRAQRIELVDKEGNVRMVLGEFNGYPQDAQVVGVKVVDKGGSIPQVGMLILDGQAHKRVMLSVSSLNTEGPSLRIMDSTGYQRAALRVGTFSDYGNADTEIKVLPETATLEFYKRGAQPPVFLGGSSAGQMYLFGQEGKFLHLTPESADGLYHDPMEQFKAK